MKSMTGFGRAEISNEQIKAVVEIKAVNHRFCDIFIKGPRNLGFLDDNIKKIINSKIARGKIDVYYYYENKEESTVDITFNENLTDKYFKTLEDIKARHNIIETISLSDIIKFPDIIKTESCSENMDSVWEKVEPLFEEATSKLMEMREYEGEKTKKDLINKLETIENLRKNIEIKAPEVPIDFGNRLKKNIEKYMEEKPIDDNRIAMEIAVFADKCTVDEELSRLMSHIVQFREGMDVNVSVGRKLDFLVQEMNRETNTIGSKANDLEITKNVVEMKSELEKIREQIQNIE